MSSQQLRRWAFTLHFDQVTDVTTVIQQVKVILMDNTKRWVFQLEEGEQGRKHLQGRLSTKNPKRVGELRNMWGAMSTAPHFSPEHDTKASDFYCTKSQGRLDGPWSDITEREVYIPPQFDFPEWNAFQRRILTLLETQQMRQILFVVDSTGNHGKTTMVGRLECLGEAIEVPDSMETSEKMVNFACGLITDVRKQYTIFLDVPRAVDSAHSWRKWLTAIERLKAGKAHDGRYSARPKIFHWPKIVVFANSYPPSHLLSTDRWVVVEP